MGDFGCELKWESEKNLAYEPCFLIDDLNRNNVLDLTIQPSWGGVGKRSIVIE